ncbi:hypothetical protein [Tatumella saanichensis]|uniref:hypothetical protein n=1 Tax=Tatumella saanichensis TaxID=480813 RepID=UPI0004B72FDD|nr:hypothetical protein [Tatumella saanichensis]
MPAKREKSDIWVCYQPAKPLPTLFTQQVAEPQQENSVLPVTKIAARGGFVV